jgi:arylsulfatase A-like enzyme
MSDASSSQRGRARLDRRAFLRQGLLTGGALAASGLAGLDLLRAGGGPRRSAVRAVAAARRMPRAPNVLIVILDQMRSDPHRRRSGPIASGITPNIEALAKESVRFVNHYAAANDCTPARSSMLTGLYTHQTGCMITGGSTLDPGFPTWGTLMREHGYSTLWFGKWHLTHGDKHWSPYLEADALQPYGFSGGTFPSPDGAPGQGARVDPIIATQLEEWLAEEGGKQPWCTTVSFVNPHDIAWWYLWSRRTASERRAPRTFHALPANFETPEQLLAAGKPTLQRSLQDTAAASFGLVPFEGEGVTAAWTPFLDLYAQLQRDVDVQVGRVLRSLASNPEVASQTVVVFTSDHGEYNAAHGLRGKGAGAYEEGIRVPLLVKDPSGRLTKAPHVVRSQLTSSVDLAPLLLTIASGSSSWRSERRYRHLARRQDLAAILASPAARGRSHVLHATDEVVTEFAIEPYAASAPLHVTALRSRGGKYVTYSHWRDGEIEPLPLEQEVELYDYATPRGRLELESLAGGALEPGMRSALERAFREELREPLRGELLDAQRRGFEDYFDTATRDARIATAQRRRRMQRDGLIAAGRPPATDRRHAG